MAQKQLSKIHQRVLGKVSENPNKDKKDVSNNNFWNDAEQHYVASIGAIAQVEGTLSVTLKQFTNDKAKLALIKEPEALADNINILTKDILEHTDRLNAIHKKHCDRTGGTVTPDEHMELLSIHGEYADALEIYQANIIPTVTYILEQIGATEELIMSMATNPEVITDVQVKEVE